MKYTVYVLQDSEGNLYKGMTSNMERRLREHRSGQTRTTARMHELRVAYTESFDTFVEARRRELYFKSAAGRRYLAKKLGP